jgi:hypothetical protein
LWHEDKIYNQFIRQNLGKIIECSKFCSNHLHSLKNMEEQIKNLNVCGVTACASVCFNEQ